MAVTLALTVLVALTAPMLALLSASTLEPLIARNQVDATQALYAAEAGLEWAFVVLVNTPDWTAVPLPPGAASTGESQPPAAVPEPVGSGILTVPSDLLPVATVTVRVRHGPPAGRPASSEDAESIVTVTSTGTVNGAQRTIEAMVRRLSQTSGSSGGTAPGRFDAHSISHWRER